MDDFSRYRCRNRRFPTAALLGPALAGLFGTSPAWADNPGYDRPGLGFTPVVLSAGDITLEQGLPTWTRDQDKGSVQSQYTTDSLLRLGIGGPFEAQLGTSPFNAEHATGPGVDSWSHGRGDTVLALKFAPCKADAALTWGLLGSVELTDGSPAVRNDHKTTLLGADVNWQLSEYDGVGGYLERTRNDHDYRTTTALNESHLLGKAVVGYVELAELHETGVGNGTEAGAGVAWLVNRRVQLDGGLRGRIAGHAQQWMVSLGVSVFLGR
ncbi:transporter [Dyella jiangningensis]|uniref:transporter n=1 Tax=Dyella jiangningensis TaxID=1379159 RepID=UPI000DCFB520|nr:transporter [Dyella jiangningensis]